MEKLTREAIKEIVGRWFQNPPFPLGAWITEAYINSLTDAQTAELVKAIDDHVLACIGEDEDLPEDIVAASWGYTRNELRAQQRQEGKVV